eukprot:scaffold169884_cov21-Tisochrysis_lutea.AAC.1
MALGALLVVGLLFTLAYTGWQSLLRVQQVRCWWWAGWCAVSSLGPTGAMFLVGLLFTLVAYKGSQESAACPAGALAVCGNLGTHQFALAYFLTKDVSPPAGYSGWTAVPIFPGCCSSGTKPFASRLLSGRRLYGAGGKFQARQTHLKSMATHTFVTE